MRRRSRSVPSARSGVMWCFRPSQTLHEDEVVDKDRGFDCGTGDSTDQETMKKAVQYLIAFTTNCIEGRADSSVPVNAAEDLRRSLEAFDQCTRSRGSTASTHSHTDTLEDKDCIPPLAGEYLKVHLSGIPEDLPGVGSHDTSVDSRPTSQRTATVEHSIAPLPPLAPQFFSNNLNSSLTRSSSAVLWPSIRASLDEDLKAYSTVCIEHTEAPAAGHTTTPYQRYPDLAPASMTATSTLTHEIDHLIHAAAATGLDMPLSSTAATSNQVPAMTPRTCIDASVANVLASMDDPGMRSWESFDVSAVARSTESPLKHVTVVALHELRLFSVFRICCTKLLRYLDVLESLYPRSNPYHNSTHAADVTQAAMFILLKDNLSSRFSGFEILAMILAAAMHDVAHPGVTNPYLRSCNNELSFIYSETSEVENMSLALGIGLLMQPELCFLDEMDQADMSVLLTLIRTIVLNTDMLYHIHLLTSYEAITQNVNPLPKPSFRPSLISVTSVGLNSVMSKVAVTPSSGPVRGLPQVSENDEAGRGNKNKQTMPVGNESQDDTTPDRDTKDSDTAAENEERESAPTTRACAKPVSDQAWEDGEFRVAAMSLLIKCADFNSVGRPPAVAGMWARAIYGEFFRQADLETELGIPPTPVFQKDSVVISEAQVQFVPSVVAPAFELLGTIAPKAAEVMLGGAQSNVAAWNRLTTSQDSSPMSVLVDADGCERTLHVFGGAALEEEGGPEICRNPSKAMQLVFGRGISTFLADKQFSHRSGLMADTAKLSTNIPGVDTHEVSNVMNDVADSSSATISGRFSS